MSKMTDRTLDDKRRKALSDMIASAGGSGIAAPLTAASLPKTASLPRHVLTTPLIIISHSFRPCQLSENRRGRHATLELDASFDCRSTTGPPSQAASVAGSSRGPSEVGGPSAQPAARPRPRGETDVTLSTTSTSTTCSGACWGCVETSHEEVRSATRYLIWVGNQVLPPSLSAD